MKKIISASVAALCFLGLCNIAGAVELDKIGFAGAIVQVIVTSAVMITSLSLGGFFNEL